MSELPLAIVTLGVDGTVASLTPAARLLLGETLDGRALLPQSLERWLPAAGEADEALSRCLRDPGRFEGVETWLLRRDGTRSPVRVSGSACGPGAALRALWLEDLTEREQLQRQMLQTEKMASIGQLAAGVAHEINNPMGFIHANLAQLGEYLKDLEQAWRGVEALQKAVEAGALENIRSASQALAHTSQQLDLEFVMSDFGKALRESNEGAERIRHIVTDLREFSHQGDAAPQWADVNQCLDSTASIAWTMMKHTVDLEKHYQTLPSLRCLPTQLKQVFMNLLVNACQAIEEKGGDEGERGTIELATMPLDDGVLIRVRDTGAGIRGEDLPHIFDPFFTTKQVGAGMGLGLSTSYSIVDRHGGSLDVRSVEGEGTTFEVWLPVEGPAGASCPA